MIEKAAVAFVAVRLVEVKKIEKRFDVKDYPTVCLVDPRTEKVLARFEESDDCGAETVLRAMEKAVSSVKENSTSPKEGK